MNRFCCWQPRTAWFGLLAALSAYGACASEPRELNAAYIHFPPIAYTDAQGLPSGDIIVLADQLAADLNLKLNWREYPINRIHHLLKSGDVDIWPASKDIPALSGFTVESRPLALRVRLNAYYRQDRNPHLGPDDLRSAQLILIRGYTYRDQLSALIADNPLSPILAPDHHAALELLNRGRGDFLISFARPVTEALKHNPSPSLGVHVIDEWPLALIVSRKTEGAQELVDAISAAYARRLARQPLPASGHSSAQR